MLNDPGRVQIALAVPNDEYLHICREVYVSSSFILKRQLGTPLSPHSYN